MPIYFYFLMTILIEMPVVLLCFKKQWKQGLLIGLLLNLFTWPLLHVFLFSTNVNINILELCVAITEGIGYWIFMQCGWKKAFAVSFLVNGLSYGIGLIMNNYL